MCPLLGVEIDFLTTDLSYVHLGDLEAGRTERFYKTAFDGAPRQSDRR